MLRVSLPMNGESVPHPYIEKWRERLERVLRISLLVFVLAAAGFLSAVTTIRIAIRGRIVSYAQSGGAIGARSAANARRPWPAIARGRPSLQLIARERGRPAKSSAGRRDEDFAGRSRCVEPGPADGEDSRSRRPIHARGANFACCRRGCSSVKSRRSFCQERSPTSC